MFRRRNLISAGVFAAVVLVINWLIESETSPLYEYFIWHVGLPNFWARLNTIPYIFALVFRSELIYWALFVAQWFLGGLLLITLLKRKPLR